MATSVSEGEKWFLQNAHQSQDHVESFVSSIKYFPISVFLWQATAFNF